MNKMKRLLMINSFILVLLLSACSNKDRETSKVTNITTPSITPTVTVTPTAALTTAKTVAAYEIPDVEIASKDIPDSESFQFIKNMKIGWNLGNTFDAYMDEPWFSDELGYESAWNGVVTTQEMIDALKDSGFNSIRIPVSWHNHVSGDDFIISDVWLDRVQEVVDYAYNKGMYVILNTHHDVSDTFYYPSGEHMDNSMKYIEQIWSQLSKRFAEYDEHLIFESMNEPRLVGTNYEWWLDINNESCIDSVKSINALNQVFVDIVRNGEGDNNKRYLMVPGYSASAQGALINEFELPKDIVKNKLIVSVHAYTPYNFALQAPTESGSISEFSSDNQNSVTEINQFMDQLYNKYISNGTPVVIGEFGARDKNGNTQDRIDFATYYIAYARANGMSCIWWDNNSFSGTGENFGLLDRKTITWRDKEIVDGLMKYAQ
ncbi:MAG: Cellulase [Anaerocolumna sp.]|nr:Cellulase [Anaerocolumna sp.]